jgi:hypothetical protein
VNDFAERAMADDNSEKTSAESKAESKAEANSELPRVDSPPLSPAGGEPSVTPERKIEPAISPAGGGEAKPLPAAAHFSLKLRPRHKRYAMLAASVTIAACLGAVIGALATAPGTPSPDTAALQERQALTQSIDKLNKDIAALKLDLETGTKSARSQIAKINDKVTERLNRPSEPQTTGSIAAASPVTVPTPQPRPDMRQETRQEMRPTVLQDWRIFDVHNGRVAVEGHGEVYEIGIGAPLPGLGPVQQIKRDGGRWVVTTPKGIIVSQRDRRSFD